MEETKALEIIGQVLKDRKAWGQAAGIRVAQWELVDALLAVSGRIFFDPADWVHKDDVTLLNRRNNAMQAQLAKAQGDSARMREQRDNTRTELKRLGTEFDALKRAEK
jgi:hypothetical protein